LDGLRGEKENSGEEARAYEKGDNIEYGTKERKRTEMGGGGELTGVRFSNGEQGRRKVLKDVAELQRRDPGSDGALLLHANEESLVAKGKKRSSS